MEGGEIDVSLIATFHREGYIAGWTLDNVARLRREADVAGLSHELICVLDTADDETASVVKGHDGLRRQDKVVRVEYGDVGLSRNEGVSRSGGEFVAMFDGDDYHSRYWVTGAHRVLALAPRKRVVHPAFVVSFGATYNILKVLDQEEDMVPPEALLTLNPWGSSIFVARRAIEHCPYQRTNVKETGFGYEDWHWNLEMLAKGYKFITAPDTALYYRRKRHSMVMQMVNASAVVRPSAFFRQPPGGERRT